MSIPTEKLVIPKWNGPTPHPIQRPPITIGQTLLCDPPVILAPMASVTNAPFRLLCREMGAGMVVTEMVSAVLLKQRPKKAGEILDLRENESPVSVQLFGKDPSTLADAAKICEDAGAHAVDLNMGCPMKKVVSSGHGAALLRDPTRIEAIFSAMSNAVSIPVTGKIRAGFEDINATDVASAIEAGGGSAITIHGRTRCDGYSGHADLAVIRELKQCVTIPLIGNGDVRDYVSARRMFSITGCDAVMVARGCLGNPWAFAEIKADLQHDTSPVAAQQSRHPLAAIYPELYGETSSSDMYTATPSSINEEEALSEFRRVILRHVRLYIETFGIERTSHEIRKHLIWYFRGTDGESEIRRSLKGITTEKDIINAVDKAIGEIRNRPNRVAY